MHIYTTIHKYLLNHTDSRETFIHTKLLPLYAIFRLIDTNIPLKCSTFIAVGCKKIYDEGKIS